MVARENLGNVAVAEADCKLGMVVMMFLEEKAPLADCSLEAVMVRKAKEEP